jgi:5-hydroxyisourate hydrolase-like protein (transthyretin family)
VRRVRVRLSGRVLARASGRSVARVTLYRRTARGWRPLARVRTSARGRFRVERRVRTSARALRLRAVGVSSGLTVRSRVVVVGVRVRH